VGKLIRVKGLKQLRGVAGIQTIGLDLGDRFSQFCAVGGKGRFFRRDGCRRRWLGCGGFLGGWNR